MAAAANIDTTAILIEELLDILNNLLADVSKIALEAVSCAPGEITALIRCGRRLR